MGFSVWPMAIPPLFLLAVVASVVVPHLVRDILRDWLGRKTDVVKTRGVDG